MFVQDAVATSLSPAAKSNSCSHFAARATFSWCEGSSSSLRENEMMKSFFIELLNAFPLFYFWPFPSEVHLWLQGWLFGWEYQCD